MFEGVTFWDVLASGAGSTAVFLLGFGVFVLNKFVKENVKSEFIQRAIFGVGEVTMNAVRRIDQTVKREILKGRSESSPEGAKLTDQEKADLKKAVLDEVKDVFGLASLMEMIGAFSGKAEATEAQVDSFITTQIESSVNALKSEKAVALSRPLAA